MTITTLWLEAATGDPEIDYAAQDDRQLIASLTTEGVASMATDFIVSQHGTGDLYVSVSGGVCFVDGDDQANQGTYQSKSDAAVVVGPFAAAPGSGGRIDLVVFKVHDVQAGGSIGSSGVEIVTGVASGSPVEPALPPSAIRLGAVRLNAGNLSILGGNITDRRVAATSPLSLNGHAFTELAGVSPTAPLDGQAYVYDAGSGLLVPKDVGGVLNAIDYQPASLTTYPTSGSFPAWATFTTLDATHAILPVTFPRSGRVIMTLAAWVTQTAGATGGWNLREGGVDVAGTARAIADSASIVDGRRSVPILVTGTPGSTHTYQWGVSGSGFQIIAGVGWGGLFMQAVPA